jgi:hypothetical protein
MAGEGLFAVRQGPHPAAADGFAALIAIDEAGAVAAMRALQTRPVEFAGVIRALRRRADRQTDAGFDLTAGIRAFVDQDDLKPVCRA